MWVFVMMSLMGLSCGGLFGIVNHRSYEPYCWYGLLIGMALYLIAKLGIFDAIADAFD